jgi:outer membrane biosynthesis protein TonB
MQALRSPPRNRTTDMTKLQESQLSGVSRTNEARTHGRRKLGTMAYVELGQDNGGILLNVSEGGLAIQSALTLTCQDLPNIRFQLPQYRGWITASGKVVWMSQSKTEAGIQFTEVSQPALAEIRRWVASEGEPAEGLEERPRVLASVGAERKAAAQSTVVDPSRWREREAVAVESAAVPAAGQDFHFTDYSMFASDPRIENLWVEDKPRRSWGGIVLLALLFGAAFFVLGAAMGPANLQHWMDRGLAYVGAAKQPAPAQSVPVQGNNPSAPGSSTADTQPNGGAPVSPQTQGTAKPSDSTSTEADSTQTDSTQVGNRSSALAARTTEARDGENEGAEPEKGSAPAAAADLDAGVNPASKRGVPVTKNPDPKANPLKRPAAASKAAGIAKIPDLRNDNVDVTHHSILVSAPEPGGLPLVIGFPNEAVSASTWVAISARRSIRIPPRAAGAYSGSKRVTIGKLISHSDPFYPVEARNKRIEGVVELRATIGRAGGILNLTPIRGPELLTKAGMTAVREWRYEPTFVDGDPEETQADIILVFRLP